METEHLEDLLFLCGVLFLFFICAWVVHQVGP